jgi:hypothetical protein
MKHCLFGLSFLSSFQFPAPLEEKKRKVESGTPIIKI